MNPVSSRSIDAPPSETPRRDALADFSTDRRVLLLCLLALPIGAIGAIVAKALLWLIAVITNAAFFLQWSSSPSTPGRNHLGWWVIVVPVAGSLLIGLMARYGSEKIRGHGIPEALESILLGRSLIDAKVAILKPVSSAVSIGTGGPFGAEGPIIMTGGAFGSLLAQLFHLTAAERKTLLVAGAAAGMSAVFATPVAAVLLAVELLLFEWKPRSFIPVAVAAVVASLLRVPLLGAGPIFPVVAHAILSPQVLGLALVVGIIVGFGSGALTGLVYTCEDLFAKLPVHWMWWPALGGLVVGLGGLIDPRVLGVGYETIHQLIRGDLLGASLVTLVVVKAIVWSVALGSGTSGGVLAPLLMIGGAIGALFGIGVGAGHPGLWAMIGMAGMMGGTMRSPFTGMVFVLELTHDLNALPALMIGSLAALCVTVLLLRRSILTEKLARRGQHIAREYSVDVFELARVADVMDRNIPLVPASLTVAAFSDRIAQGDPALSGRQGTILVDAAGRLAGVITRGDILPALQAGTAATTTLRDVASTDVVVAYPDETLRHAIGKMLNRGVGRLPVVERSDSGRVIGYLGRADILAVHVRLHEEEELLERGPLLSPASPRQIDHVAVLPPRSHASHFARSGSPLASQLRQMLSLVRPKEHGSWSLALEPLVLGLIAVPSLAGIALGAAVLAGFFLRRPFKVVTCDGDPRRIHAWVCVASLGALTAAGVTLAAVLATPTGLWPLLLAVPPGLAFAWFESRGEARAAAAELAGAVAFSVVPAALATAAGWRTLPALALAAIMAGREVPTVMTIRAYLRRRKGKAGSTLAPLLAALIALIGAGALVHERLAPLTAVLFLALLFVRTVALLGPYHLRLGATRLGVAEAIVGGTGVTLLALDWPH